ncbi:hypothetical protein Amsp01_010610 [Amycolatopsis sp. NBRC 101858]|uniref:hypothetical protein n=1 Tax=Amycolatopsis sp. NBRC 101858 TaxID=3032200 RepID=UPI0024A2A0A5|nr:hypothetical protein [Amycolatopsis sp. NBRC 101858]GLY35037.1 hypothetical protein Amsp01_010610 [Amycolatopsis sp. NBRC 101858]
MTDDPIDQALEKMHRKAADDKRWRAWAEPYDLEIPPRWLLTAPPAGHVVLLEKLFARVQPTRLSNGWVLTQPDGQPTFVATDHFSFPWKQRPATWRARRAPDARVKKIRNHRSRDGKQVKFVELSATDNDGWDFTHIVQVTVATDGGGYWGIANRWSSSPRWGSVNDFATACAKVLY